MMKQIASNKNFELTPLDLISIFYDEALKIASSDDEAVKLTNETVVDFLSHYRPVKKRSEG